MKKIQAGDLVKVISGAHKGHVGTITKVYNKKDPKTSKIANVRVAVSGLKKIQKFRKSFTFQGQKYPGQIFDIDRKIDISNVMLVSADNKVSRVKIQIDEAGKKTRVLVKTGDTIQKNKIVKEKKSAETEEVQS
jgi:large subunit ribosomal protein L24